jgi:hypothetical protein
LDHAGVEFTRPAVMLAKIYCGIKTAKKRPNLANPHFDGAPRTQPNTSLVAILARRRPPSALNTKTKRFRTALYKNSTASG